MKLSEVHPIFRSACIKQGLFQVFGGVAVTSLMLLAPGKAVASAATAIIDSMPTSVPAQIIADWEAQDGITGAAYGPAIDKIIAKLPTKYKAYVTAGTTKQAYLVACHWRRVARMQMYSGELKKVLFTRHYNLGGPDLGRLADLAPDNFSSGIGLFQTTMSRGNNYKKNSALCLLELKNYYSKPVDLLSDSTGVIRDPSAWYDGSKVAFAWSKDDKGYHLFEMPLDNPAGIKQLTDDPEGLTVSDFEPCYLPDSNIVFNSTRSFGFISSIACANTNLFMMDKEGKYLRRVTYDQFSNYSPSVMEDGYVLYSRWEANDRNAINCFPLMSMNVDGVHQIEYYGNNSPWPGALFQARRVPSSTKILSIIGVRDSPYAGELVMIDPLVTRNGSKGVQLIAPERDPVDTINVTTNPKPLFQNPCPFDETWFMVSWRPTSQGSYQEKFGIYFMSVDGQRELLAWDSLQSVCQPISLMPKTPPSIKMYQTDYMKTTGRVTLYDAYAGMGVDKTIDSAGAAIKKLRVVALDLRTDPAFGHTGSSDFCMTPVSRYLGSREAKRVIGEAPVAIDGSAAFLVPARTPLYFQLIDANGSMVQTMRSTVTLQPGELFACVGCHENKNESTGQGRLAINYLPVALDTFFNISNTPFSFPKIIQPILDAKCIGCHNAQAESGLNLMGDSLWTGDLTTDADNKNASRYWSRSYYNLTDTSKKYVDFITSNSTALMLKCNTYGSSKSKLVQQLIAGHKDTVLTKEQLGKICAWIDLGCPFSGTYTEGMKPDVAALYEQRLARRTNYELLDAANVAAFEAAGGYPLSVEPRRDGKTGQRRMAAGCRITVSYARAGRLLSVGVPSAGTVSLVDLRGRRVWSREITHDAFVKSSSVSVRAAFPAGLYIVNFTGGTGSARRMVSIL